MPNEFQPRICPGNRLNLTIKPLILALVCTALVCPGAIFAQKLPSKKKRLEVATLANQYFMNKWPDPVKPIHVPSRNRTWPSNI